MRQLKFSITSILCCLCLLGCDAKYWPGFGGAKPVPDARILIELPEPLTLIELYPDFVEVASQGGFAHLFRFTGSLPIEQLLSDSYTGSRSSISWTEQPNQETVLVRRVKFSIKTNNREERDPTKRVTNSVTFIFQRDGTENFTKEEWHMFFSFYREILPRVFQHQDARLSISRNPALFTDRELLLEIQAETDFEIPERYLER